MAVSIAALGSVSSKTTGTTLNVNKPSGIVGGQSLLICHCSGDAAFTSPGSWNTLDSDTTTGIHTYVFWKIAEAGDEGAGTIAFTTPSGASSGYMYRIEGHHTSSPIGANNSGNGSSTTPTVTTITPASEESLIMFFVGAESAGASRTNASYTIATSPPTFTEQYDSQWDSNNYHISAAAGVRSASTATGSGTSTLSGSDPWAAVMVAISPEPQSPNITPAALSLTSTLPAAALLISSLITPSAVAISASSPPPTVTTQELASFTNVSKNNATASDVSKNAATATNIAKNAATASNITKTQ